MTDEATPIIPAPDVGERDELVYQRRRLHGNLSQVVKMLEQAEAEYEPGRMPVTDIMAATVLVTLEGPRPYVRAVMLAGDAVKSAHDAAVASTN